MKVRRSELRWRPVNPWRDLVTGQSTSKDFFEAKSIKLEPKSVLHTIKQLLSRLTPSGLFHWGKAQRPSFTQISAAASQNNPRRSDIQSIGVEAAISRGYRVCLHFGSSEPLVEFLSPTWRRAHPPKWSVESQKRNLSIKLHVNIIYGPDPLSRAFTSCSRVVVPCFLDLVSWIFPFDPAMTS